MLARSLGLGQAQEADLARDVRRRRHDLDPKKRRLEHALGECTRIDRTEREPFLILERTRPVRIERVALVEERADQFVDVGHVAQVRAGVKAGTILPVGVSVAAAWIAASQGCPGDARGLLDAAQRYSLCAQTEEPPLYKYVSVEGPIDDRTGTGDKAQAGDDFIPDEWREEAERE